MDLRQLRYFVTVVDMRGVRPASRELYVTQPALSRALRQLEVELGVRLLTRTPQGVDPTEAGLDFLAHARSILASADAATDAMRDRARTRRGIRIGVVAGILGAGELTAPIIQRFRDHEPGVDLALEDLSFCDQVGPLLAGRLDAALVRGPLDHPDLEVVPLASEPRMLLVGGGHELAGEAGVDVEDVLDQPTLRIGAPDSWASFWYLDDERGAANAHATLPVTTTIANMQLNVASSNAVITVPAAMARLAPNPLVRCLELRGAPPSTIGVARRRTDRRPEVDAFIGHAGRATEDLIGLLPGGALIG
ncbi:LysR family transcriptional regulator [Paraconexibacter antarcticus]|uniref:LysR family transcriptional regulator n=1 Tax=Paraconexibacter antarcticus TaxID=2949664 RepID=A0ABY5DLF5_9ACTN|nr:LysR family transcriptional regulator [Paraconexibacter antarcticus]UTI62658.1 LysR family transcriptional regulator [Paraconexibacter antarcticus]